MSTTAYFGSPSLAERAKMQHLVYKTLIDTIGQLTRCAMPGIIKSFDPIKQYATVQLTIAELVRQPDGSRVPTEVPLIQDVPVLLPGGHDWFITFPNLVGCECLVIFADLCISAWATHGMDTDAGGKTIARKQERERRHSLSDGFCILAPRSQPNTIQNYSSSSMEIRNAARNILIQLTSSPSQVEITVNGTTMIVDSTGMTVQGNLTVTGTITGQSTMSVQGATIGGKAFGTHVHTGVQTGGGTSGPPQ